jgi:hypothetical protein
MAVSVSLERFGVSGDVLRLGSFGSVEIRHRRLLGDGAILATRLADGQWAAGAGRYVIARIEPTAPRATVSLSFQQSWKGGDRRLRPRLVKLIGDRLLTGLRDAWSATDVDDDRAWIDERTGRAFNVLRAT